MQFRYHQEVTSLVPTVPSPLSESSAIALEWPRLREHIAAKSVSPLGRAFTLALEPCTDLAWITSQQTRTVDMRAFLNGGGSFDFHGLFDPATLLDKARIPGSALEPLEILALLTVVDRIAAWRTHLTGVESARRLGTAIRALTEPLMPYDLGPLLRSLRGKIEADGSISDDASPELRRIRRAMEAQHRAIEASLRRAARALREDGSTQEDIITVRGERFVIPIKAEFKRKVPGVIHGSSSSGQTVFVEPMETIEQNNELVRLLDEEQSEIHRILVALTAGLASHAPGIMLGAEILAEVESHFVRARFAMELDCATPTFSEALALKNARHPLLELRMRSEGVKPVPLTLALESDARQLIISGPNTGGKTVSLKTTGLLALMAQAGLPVPAEEATFPLFTAIYADIGDAQSIERNLSSFSAHVVNVNHISRHADESSLVLLDELGSATDPEEGAALAVAVAGHFLALRCWTCITTHLTSLKVYAASRPGVLNAAVGFNQQTLAPTYELKLGVPGASAGLNIAERLGMQPEIIAAARAQMTTQQADIGAFLDSLHEQLSTAIGERVSLKRRLEEVAAERIRLETEGRAEQKQRTRELEIKLNQLLEDFEAQLRDSVKDIEDKTVARKIARDSALRMSRVRREFSEQFSSTVLAHTTGADKGDPNARPSLPKPGKEIKVGDLVMLKSMGRQARVDRLLDHRHPGRDQFGPAGVATAFEVSMGQMKMRVTRADIVEIESVKVVTPLEAARRRGGVTVRTNTDLDYTPSEINVIGQTAAEAEDEVEKYIDRAFLAGLPRVRIVHGTGMGVLRRTLREFLKSHPHVATFAEASQSEGGQGATLVELRQ